MSSKRARRRRGCAGKVRHLTQRRAVFHLIELQHKSPGQHMSTYKCRFCRGWHVGHHQR